MKASDVKFIWRITTAGPNEANFGVVIRGGGVHYRRWKTPPKYAREWLKHYSGGRRKFPDGSRPAGLLDYPQNYFDARHYWERRKRHDRITESRDHA